MKLGILINSDRHLEHVVGLTRAAVAKGHEVSLFAMDEGTKLLRQAAYVELSVQPGVSMSVCEHSASRHAVPTADLPKTIVCGSQLQNAIMVHDADRVLVL